MLAQERHEARHAFTRAPQRVDVDLEGEVHQWDRGRWQSKKVGSDPTCRVQRAAGRTKVGSDPTFHSTSLRASATWPRYASKIRVKASLIGTTQPVLIDGGKLVLGRWQAVYFVELDGPRRREVLARVQKA